MALQNAPGLELISDDLYYILNAKGYYFFNNFLHYLNDRSAYYIGHPNNSVFFTGPNFLYQYLISFAFYFNVPVITIKLFNVLMVNSIIFPAYFILKKFNKSYDSILFSSSLLFFPQLNLTYFAMTENLALPLFFLFLYGLYKFKSLPKILLLIVVFSVLFFFARPHFLLIVIASLVSLFSLLLIRYVSLSFNITNTKYTIFLLVSIVSSYKIILSFWDSLSFIEKYFGFYAGNLTNWLHFPFPELLDFSSRFPMLNNLSLNLNQIIVPFFLASVVGFSIFQNRKVYGINLIWLTVMIHFFLGSFLMFITNYSKSPINHDLINPIYLYYSRYFLSASTALYFISFIVKFKKRLELTIFSKVFIFIILIFFFFDFFTFNPSFNVIEYWMSPYGSIEIAFFLIAKNFYAYQLSSFVLLILISIILFTRSRNVFNFLKRLTAYYFIFISILHNYAYFAYQKELFLWGGWRF